MNLLQTVLGLLTPALTGKIAGMLGESPEATAKTLGGVAPAIIGALIQKSGSAKGTGELVDMFKEHKIDGGMLDQIGDLLGGGDKSAALQNTGGSILTSILGDKLGPIGNLLSAFGGVKAANAQGLMGLIAPLIMGAISKHLGGSMDTSKLVGLLGDQREHVAKALPPGLGALLGMAAPATGMTTTAASSANARPTAPIAGGVAKGAAHTVAQENKNDGLVPWLLGAVALAAIALIGPRTCAQAPTAAIEQVAGQLKLPGGEMLQVPPGSIGEQLFKFLSGAETAPKTFTFDNLNFQTGSATLTTESQAAVDAIGKTMKAFPTVEATLDGYTDNQGGARANQRLSESRARTVMDAMVAMGIDAARLKTAGRGAEKPVGDNATEEGRAKHRRIELTVTKK
jgi:outer membrane protein OmpA-like peptidoglycan-associated protein